MRDTFECRRSYYKHLTRPDGSMLSEKDSLLLDLCVQWTKGGKVATSTYAYLLEEKFPRQNHPVTVKRTFDNISLYINAKFKNTHIIEGKEFKDKIRIERVNDFDLKMDVAMDKSNKKRGQQISTKCRSSKTVESTMKEQNVDPTIYIEKNTNKNTNKTDIKDLTEDQVINSDNFNSEPADYVESSDHQNSGEYWSKNLEYNVDIQINEFENSKLESELESERVVQRSYDNPSKERVTFTNEDGNKLWGIPLAKYRYSEAMLEEIRDGSNKQHFTIDRVEGLFQRLAGKYPDKLIIGGKKGFISYMTKALNGEKEDYQEVILRSIEEQSLKAYQDMEYRLANGNEFQYW